MTSASGRADSDGDGEPATGWLTRADQLAVGLLIGSALIALPLYWLAHGGWSGRLIEIERAAPREFHFLVDVNAADWPELSQLPGVGETLARRIVEWRAANGPYSSSEDLRRVSGIGAATLEALRPHLAPLPGDGVVAPEEAPR